MSVDPLQTVAAGGVVLTVNKRLARHLAHLYNHQQITAGRAAWPTPAIFSLDAWAIRHLQGLGLAEALLNDAQSQQLWDEVLAADVDTAGRDLLQRSPAAQRARAAQRLLFDYQAEVAVVEADADQLAFLRWRTDVGKRMRAGNWLDRGDLLPAVIAGFAEGRCAVPDELVLAGFDDLKPVECQLWATLAERGCRIRSWHPPPVPGAQLSLHAATDMTTEIRACACWARRLLENQAQARIGVVVPQLAEYQGLIERIFRAEFAPQTGLPGTDDDDTFTLSLGRPLDREGVIRAALRLLAGGDPLRLEDAGWLLRSPYLDGAEAEGLARATADRRLRKGGRSEWHLGPLRRSLAEVPRMAAIVSHLQQSVGDRRRRLPGEWAGHFSDLLDRCGWPGPRGLSSREFQALVHLRETFGQFASLDRVALPLARGEALTVLARLVSGTVFQPESDDGQVQVLGMLEAAGFTFDALWIIGLHEGAFPVPARPNPFLPLSLQSRLRMPHADAGREREFAERLAARLFVAAPEVVASWPGQRDGALLRPSPLLRGFPPANMQQAPSRDPVRIIQAAPCRLEQLVDDRGLALPTDRPCSGGTRILTDQALCPFRAFAHHRLHAEALEYPDLGLDNLARGNLVHGVLERFWRRVGHSAALLELDGQRRAELLAAVTEESLQQHERRSRCDLPPRLRRLESRRLAGLVEGWLDLERQRPPFRVAAIEQWHEARAGRLRLRTRVDRIDELPGGRLAVIDYKTGRPSPRQWLEPRVTEPQLPLYCLDLESERIDAVLFAMVRSREKQCAFKGLARDPGCWPTLSASNQAQLLAEYGWERLDDVIDHWRSALSALGDAFVDGAAAVDPIDTQLACKYCDLAILCRIGSTFDASDPDRAGGDDDE